MRNFNLLVLYAAILFGARVFSYQLPIISDFNLTNPLLTRSIRKSSFTDVGNDPANVQRLELSATKISTGCSDDLKIGSEKNVAVKVRAEVSDPNDDVFTYVYKVSSGVIIGEGKEVVWDLSGVKPGKHTIFSAADDSGGIYGQTQTKKISVVKNSRCK